APPEPAEDTERALSAIDQDIVALDTRRTQIALGRDQRRETLARLEEQFRGQAETIEALRREREAAAGSSAASGGTDDPALREAREAEAAAAERRRDAELIQAQLDAVAMPVRIDLLKLEAQVDELELAWI